MPADLVTPELSSESDSEREDNTRDGVVDPHRMLALSVVQQAITDGATHWFFPATRGQVSSSGAELRNCSHPGFRRESGLQSLSQLIALGWS